MRSKSKSTCQGFGRLLCRALLITMTSPYSHVGQLFGLLNGLIQIIFPSLILWRLALLKKQPFLSVSHGVAQAPALRWLFLNNQSWKLTHNIYHSKWVWRKQSVLLLWCRQNWEFVIKGQFIVAESQHPIKANYWL